MAMATQASLFTPPSLPAPPPAQSRNSAPPPSSSRPSSSPQPKKKLAPQRQQPRPKKKLPRRLPDSPPAARPQLALPGLRRQHGGAPAQGAGRGVLRDHMGVPEGAGVRDAHGWGRDHAGGANLLKLARKEQCLALGTRLRSKYKIKYQFYRVFPNGGAVPAPQGRGVPGEGEPGPAGGRPELPLHREERQPHRGQVHRQAALRFVTDGGGGSV
ncbi:photosystem I reaction center subunit II, chloroplastic-like [Iris pallida]|uniref:Photosystem I reaction center subunit II, chloroplastic n=1 Tax=Iris pallida TaxID=29817 RepID=A0AAX6E611_IRIPA|nr:photosystem I reaction center subunit II, chloroplastic-like [Iris pallida]